MAAEPTIVQAIYSFKGTNNDELCFKKGDKITITQREEGGWWEGTLGDKTGWFPSNYVKECKDVSPALSPVAQQRQYRAVVLKDLIDSEKAHVAELQGLVKNFLQPLEKSSILTVDEYRQLTGNINEVLETHQQLLNLLEESEQKPSNEQRVGKIFLNRATCMKSVHQAYCANHPKAVCIIDKYKNDLTTFMESCGAATPGLIVLTTGLSKPFRRLDKYFGMLQELERHVEESHPDRGDTQRSVAVYKDMAATCAATRRQKELELQVLTGPVRGWEGQSLSNLGEILHMGSVAVGPQHSDRYFVLFSSTLLVLSVSHRMSAFIYEGKLPLTGITVNKLEDSEAYKNAFEISGPLIERIVAVCQSQEEAQHWVDILRQHMRGTHKSPPPPVPSSDTAPQLPPHMSPMPTNARTSANNRTPSTNSQPHDPQNDNRGWSASCLRPAPPLRPCLSLGSTATGSPVKSNRRVMSYEEDAMILRVIESYCTSAKGRNAIDSASGDSNKEDRINNDNTERSLVECYLALRDQTNELQNSVASLSLQLVEEKMARCALQNILKEHMLSSGKDVDSISWPLTETNC